MGNRAETIEYLRRTNPDFEYRGEVVDSSAFATVYKTYVNGEPLAIKAFKEVNATNIKIVRRMQLLRPFFESEPFVAIREANDRGPLYYTMDFVSGTNVERDLHSLSNEQKLLAAHTYIKALQEAHGSGLLLGDNSWSKVLLNDQGAFVCDHDTMAPQSIFASRNPYVWHKLVDTPRYRSRGYERVRQVDPTAPIYVGDELQSFGKMLSALLGRTPFVDLPPALEEPLMVLLKGDGDSFALNQMKDALNLENLVSISSRL